MNERELLLKKISQQQFAAHEIALYLDTHPEDRQALNAFRTYRDTAVQLQAEYSQKYGMLTHSSPDNSDTWNWVRNPWPWDC